MVANDFGADVGGQNDVANEERRLAGGPPHPGDGGADEDVAGDADHGADMSSPFGIGEAVAWHEHFDEAGLVAAMALFIGTARTIERSLGVAERGDGMMQSGLVGLDLSDQVYAARGSLLVGFF